MKAAVNIFWFRRDLRLTDNAGLYHALRGDQPVLPVFIFDTDILEQLEDKKDARVEFIFNTVMSLREAFEKMGTRFEILHGRPIEVFRELLEQYQINKVFANGDYEPYARERDSEVDKMLRQSGASLHLSKDQVIFEKQEITKDDGSPYVVFTPYGKKWRAAINKFYLKSYPTEKYTGNLFRSPPQSAVTLASLGFERTALNIPANELSTEIIRKYKDQRDYPALEGTSRMGIHLRFGTISIRMLAREMGKLSDVYLTELIWREFYQMILWHFPHVGKGKAFKLEYDNIKWRNNEEEFAKWCEGLTGYPLVDAGIRELNATGFMHNRVRMVVASFLTKHLLIDWRWGEAYFAQKLLDYDLASNNGGWQWAAGSGCDAAPYFRIFNPALQAKKFDPQLKYIRKWVPELETMNYPPPIVEHEMARKRCLEVYAKALKK